MGGLEHMDSVPFLPDAAAITTTESVIALTLMFEATSLRQRVIGVSELEAWLKQILQDAIDQNQPELGSV